MPFASLGDVCAINRASRRIYSCCRRFTVQDLDFGAKSASWNSFPSGSPRICSFGWMHSLLQVDSCFKSAVWLSSPFESPRNRSRFCCDGLSSKKEAPNASNAKIRGRWMHSLRQCKSGTRSVHLRGKSKKEAPKASYMRDTIAGVCRILRSSPWEEARQQLRNLPFKWDSYTVNQVLKTHPPMEKAWLFFLWVDQVKGFKHDHFTYTTMLDIFGEAGRISSMEYIFREMEERGVRIDAATYTSKMHWLAKAGDIEGALKLWDEMKNTGCDPTVVSYTAFMKILFDHGRTTEASSIYKEMIEVGLSPTCHTYTVLIEHLAGSGKFEAAIGIMNSMREAGVEPDKATCNILVEKCSELGEISTMIEVLRFMKKNSLVLRLPVFLEALKTLRNSNENDRLLREVNPHFSSVGNSSEELSSDQSSCTDSAIIALFLCNLNFAAIDLMLENMILQKKELGSELISTLIQTSAKSQRLRTALLAFQLSVQIGETLEREVYLSLLGPLMRSSRFPEVIMIIEEMRAKGLFLGAYLSSALTLKLVLAGEPAIAAELLTSSSSSSFEWNTLTYTALIHAHLQSMEVERGLKIYARMREKGFAATSGTYKVLIDGMEMAGRKEEAGFFRTERKKLLHKYCSEDMLVPVEERICDFLFSSC